ncbi:MAG: tetratricopeptide repeat protein [Myxococcales bacterium]|nr:tetratricopeptide repeat protein [Myxococcales bacterium]
MPLNEVSPSRSPEELLRRALEADSPKQRAELAREGLELGGDSLEPDTALLLLRQLYLAHVDSHRFQTAIDIAAQMAALDTPLKDIAHHDASRAHAALGQSARAIEEQRLAARAAPPDRRSFQSWALATLLHFSGDLDGAEAALLRAERWAREDRPLLRGHRAWILLEAGDAVDDLDAVLRELESSARARKGYGELVLGMLRHHMGDERAAATHLRTFLRRNADVDSAKAITLREELRRARTILAEIESD